MCARGPSSSRSPPSPKSRGPAANPPTSLNANPSVVHTNPAANTYADSTIGPYEKCSYRRRVPNSDPSPKVTVGPPSPISSTLRRTNRIAYRWKIPRKIPSGDVLAHFTPARNPPTKTGHRLRRGLQPPHPRLWRPGCAQVAPACASEKSTSPPPDRPPRDHRRFCQPARRRCHPRWRQRRWRPPPGRSVLRSPRRPTPNIPPTCKPPTTVATEGSQIWRER